MLIDYDRRPFGRCLHGAGAPRLLSVSEALQLLALAAAGRRHPVLGDPGALARDALGHPDVALVAAVTQPDGTGYTPDLLTPKPLTGPDRSILDTQLDAIASATLERTVVELATWRFPAGRMPRQVRSALDAGTFATRAAAGLATFWRAAFADGWAVIRSSLEADLARRADTMAHKGIGQLLSALHPRLSFDGAQLHFASRFAKTCHLDGADLVLTPTVMGWPTCSFAGVRPGKRDHHLPHERRGRAPAGRRAAGHTIGLQPSDHSGRPPCASFDRGAQPAPWFGTRDGLLSPGRHARVVDQRDQRGHALRRPVARHQFLARPVVSLALRMMRITSSILATAMARPTSVWARSRALTGGIWSAGAITSSRNATKAWQHVEERHQLRPAAVERHHVGAERGLQRREAIELVEDDVGDRLALQLDHDAHALAVGLVANVGDAFDFLVADQFGDLLDHHRLVHLVGDLGDDDRLAVLPRFPSRPCRASRSSRGR